MADVGTMHLSMIAQRIRGMEALQDKIEFFVRLNWVGLSILVELGKGQLVTEGLKDNMILRVRDELIHQQLTGNAVATEKRQLQAVKKQWQRRLRTSRRWAELYWHFGAGVLDSLLFDLDRS